MARAVRLSLVCVGLALVLFPLTLRRPGLPMTFKADEPAYYLMALSLARDFDLRCEAEDIRRLAEEFPFHPLDNLILMTSDGWQTAHFGKPYPYSLLAAPLAAVFGGNGLIALNMLLFLGMIALGWRYLEQFNPSGIALLFSSGFFFLSSAFSYVFWMHTEVLCMAAVTASLYLALRPALPSEPGAGGRWHRTLRTLWSPATRPAFSAAALMLAAYHKPVLAALALPALWVFWRHGRRRAFASWLVGAALAAALLCGLSVALTGQPSAYLGAERGAQLVWDFDRVPFEPRVAPPADEAPGREANAWWWIFRVPEIDPQMGSNLLHFLVGRHTGLFVYMPFSLVALLLYLGHARRSVERGLVLAALAGIALFFLLWIPFNWHGGAGFVGNRYFVNAYPALLFLVTSVTPAWLIGLGFGLGGLFVAPLVFTPFGAPVPEPTLQAHVRNAPYRFLPFELSLWRQIPGYTGVVVNGSWFLGRRDVFQPRATGELWMAGGGPVEVWVFSESPLVRPVFQLRSPRRENRVTVRLGDAARELRFEPGDGDTQRFTLAPSVPAVRRDAEGGRSFLYRLTVRAERMRLPQFEPGADLPETPFPLGAELLYFGPEEEFERDLYRARLAVPELPAEWEVGQRVTISGQVANESDGVWPARPPGQVALAYRWLRTDGTLAVEGGRLRLPGDLAPGEALEFALEVTAPGEAGDYVLQVEPVRERIAWFSQVEPGSTFRSAVRVVPAATSATARPTTGAGSAGQ